MAALDKGIARRVKQGVERFAETGTGDVKRLEPPLTGFRLRCGDYRVFFDLKDESTVEMPGLPHQVKQNGVKGDYRTENEPVDGCERNRYDVDLENPRFDFGRTNTFWPTGPPNVKSHYSIDQCREKNNDGDGSFQATHVIGP